MTRRRDDRALDLLAWQPPAPPRFAPEAVRAASLRAMLCKAVAVALKDCGKGRDQVATEMAEFLGEAVSKAMLDAYASEAREDHSISVVRLLALIHVTGDLRLLNLLAEQLGQVTIPARYLPAIEDAMLDDKIEELTQRRQLARKRWKGGL